MKLFYIGTTLVLLGFVNGLQHTVIASSLPLLGTYFDTPHLTGWLSIAFTLASILASPVIGYLANSTALKPLFRFGFGMMVLGFLITVFADSFWVFILGRAISGIGGGALSLLPSVFLARYVSVERRTKLDAGQIASYTIGTFVGPLIGAGLLYLFDWRSIFILSGVLFVGIALLWEKGVARWSETPTPFQRDKVFVQETLSFLLCLTGILLVVELIGVHPTHPLFILLCIGTVALFVAYRTYAKRSKNPLFPSELVKNRLFYTIILYSLVFGYGKLVFITFLPVYSIQVMEYSYLVTTYLLTSLVVGSAIGNILAGQLVTRIAYKNIFLLSMLLQHIGLAVLVFVEQDAIFFWLSITFLLGLANGFAGYPGLLILQYSFPTFAGSVASSNNMARHFGGVLGVVIFQQFVYQNESLSVTGFTNGYVFLWVLFTLISLLVVLLPYETIRKRNESTTTSAS